MCLFPEGTTTSGKFLLKFKKGAFFTLLPVKPVVVNSVFDEDGHSFAVGASEIPANWLKSLTYLRTKVFLAELPVIRPTQYMYEKYSEISNEKWEVYAEVTRRIYSEITGYKLSDKSLKDSKKYEDAMYSGIYKIEEDNKKTN